ncbi:hypothetical protein SH668x_002912 [Planctomicrobium sp. SH668]|uniref:hypothetical protein n=1 Tax=Planctomicrobium sp. SH668 TaxID=3448126 RepID=UPI003F5B695F
MSRKAVSSPEEHSSTTIDRIKVLPSSSVSAVSLRRGGHRPLVIAALPQLSFSEVWPDFTGKIGCPKHFSVRIGMRIPKIPFEDGGTLDVGTVFVNHATLRKHHITAPWRNDACEHLSN